MDLSKEYVDMCEKAHEIQMGLTSINHGDFIFYRWYENKIIIDEDGSREYKKEYSKTDTYCDENPPLEKFIWLPRQDQLQEMVDKEDCNIIYRKYKGKHEGTMYYAKEAYVKEQWTPYLAFDSREQVMLALVMLNKFNKKWEDGNWINL